MLSSLHIVQYGEFYFDLVTDGDFEIQYIISHETRISRLWHMIMTSKNYDIILQYIPQFFRKYDFYFDEHIGGTLEGTDWTVVGILATQYSFIREGDNGFLDANRWGQGSMNANYIITSDIDGRLIIHNHRYRVREITNNLWDEISIQAFIYGGDVTLISRTGILSELSDLFEDTIYFNLVVDGDFELLYIMYHEQPSSMLWQFLVELKA